MAAVALALGNSGPIGSRLRSARMCVIFVF